MAITHNTLLAGYGLRIGKGWAGLAHSPGLSGIRVLICVAFFFPSCFALSCPIIKAIPLLWNHASCLLPSALNCMSGQALPSTLKTRLCSDPRSLCVSWFYSSSLRFFFSIRQVLPCLCMLSNTDLLCHFLAFLHFFQLCTPCHHGVALKNLVVVNEKLPEIAPQSALTAASSASPLTLPGHDAASTLGPLHSIAESEGSDSDDEEEEAGASFFITAMKEERPDLGSLAEENEEGNMEEQAAAATSPIPEHRPSTSSTGVVAIPNLKVAIRPQQLPSQAVHAPTNPFLRPAASTSSVKKRPPPADMLTRASNEALRLLGCKTLPATSNEKSQRSMLERVFSSSPVFPHAACNCSFSFRPSLVPSLTFLLPYHS